MHSITHGSLHHSWDFSCFYVDARPLVVFAMCLTELIQPNTADGGGTSTLVSRQSESGSCVAVGLGRRVEDPHVGGFKRRPQSADLRRRPPLARELDDCRKALAGHVAVRRRQNEHSQSGVSIR